MAQEYAKPFYNSSRWKKCRNGYMISKNYICERCGELAYICHHKEHITQLNINDENITLGWDNLQALCHDCHNTVHGYKKACIDGVSFDEDGNLMYRKVNTNENI